MSEKLNADSGAGRGPFVPRLAPALSHDGQAGPWQPAPSDIEVPRLKGMGLAGLPVAQVLASQSANIAEVPAGLETVAVEESGENYVMTHHEHLEAVRSGILGSVHSWELVTAVDGPGTRLTVFLAGCPLRCLYCHNPDTLQMRRGQPVLASDLLERIAHYRKVFKATGGGVTFSGGEPLMQPAFLARLLAGAKELGVHTTIDTSGFLGVKMSEKMLGNLDLVLLDLKSGDPDTYKRVTGQILEPTVRFGQRLADAQIPMWIRFVLVPGLTDDKENIRSVARIAARWPSVERIEVLPFHQMGRDKWETLGMKYELTDTEPPSREATREVRHLLREFGDWEVF